VPGPVGDAAAAAAAAAAANNPAKPAEPAPQYVTREDLAAEREAMLTAVRSLAESLRPAPAAPVEPVDEPINLGEIDQIVADGRGGAAEKIAAMAERIADRRVKQVIKEQIDPLRNFGSASLANLARDRGLSAAAETAGKNGDKYVKQYTKEIDAFMSTMSPEVKTDVESWKKASALVLGQHMPEILAAETEQAHRAALDSRPETTQVTQPLVDDDGSPLPKMEEFFTADDMRALQEKGIKSMDEFAQRLGYKDSREYLKLAKRIDDYDQDLI
jgi:hypothetical protein